MQSRCMVMIDKSVLNKTEKILDSSKERLLVNLINDSQSAGFPCAYLLMMSYLYLCKLTFKLILLS